MTARTKKSVFYDQDDVDAPHALAVEYELSRAPWEFCRSELTAGAASSCILSTVHVKKRSLVGIPPFLCREEDAGNEHQNDHLFFGKSNLRPQHER